MKTLNRIIRGVVALGAFGLAVQEYLHSGFSLTASFLSVVGIVLGWMAATGQG